jgi:HlyD family secretion protein
VIDITALPGDRVKKFEEGVRVGEWVEEGAKLAELESYEIRDLEVQLALSQLGEAKRRAHAEEQMAEAKAEAARLGVEQAKSQSWEIAAQKEQVQLLTKKLELVQTTEKNLIELHEKNPDLVTTTELNRQRLLVEQAMAEKDAAEALLGKMTKLEPLALEAAKAEQTVANVGKDLVVASLPEASLKTQLRMAEKQREQSIITASSGGTILEIPTRAHELIGPKPLVRLANLEKMVVVAEVYEADVKSIRVNQQAMIDSRAFPAPHDNEGNGLRGKVVQIGRIISSPSLTDRNPYARQDRPVLEVRVEIDEEGSKIASRFVGMEVKVRFLADSIDQ